MGIDPDEVYDEATAAQMLYAGFQDAEEVEMSEYEVEQLARQGYHIVEEDDMRILEQI